MIHTYYLNLAKRLIFFQLVHLNKNFPFFDFEYSCGTFEFRWFQLLIHNFYLKRRSFSLLLKLGDMKLHG
jgi:hypothetical protein